MKKLFLAIATISIIFFISGCTKEQQEIINTNNEILQQTAATENNHTEQPYKPFEDFYTPAFQLIWNDFSEKLVKHKIEFANGNPPFVDNLNKKRLTENMLLPEDYYKIIAPQTYNTKRIIEKALKEKFNETSKLLNSLEWHDNDDGLKKILYCMFKKNVYFEHEFEHLNSRTFNKSEKHYKYFGTDGHNKVLARLIAPIYYKDMKDFAVRLYTKSGDEIILQTIQEDKPVFEYWDKLYNDYLNKGTEISFKKDDELVVPEIIYSQMLTYSELCGRKIINSDYMISKAIEAVDFKLNAKGAELKNEAIMAIDTTAMPDITSPNLYIFNRPFILFLRSKDGKIPYFALKIKDTRYLVEKKQ